MPGYFDKDKLKESLDLENIFDLISSFGGEPEYTSKGLISQTICHNPPGEGSRKLYYFTNTKLFKCWTGCGDDAFDIFTLTAKVMKIQKGLDWELYDAMEYVANYFGIAGEDKPQETNVLADWDILNRYEQNKSVIINNGIPELQEYDRSILDKFSYPRILRWEKEGISKEVSRRNLIGYYPGGEQITIPHFDENSRLIGIRGRTLGEEDAERYGKYRPLYVNGTLYTHPLSMNLYNLNNSKENIKKARAAVIYESEKSCLISSSCYGINNDISVACCGSNISNYQMNALLRLGVQEVIIAFDRQFQNIGDEEFQRLKRKLIGINKKYGNEVRITAIFDKNMINPYKAGPIDQGVEIFEKLLKERIVPR